MQINNIQVQMGNLWLHNCHSHFDQVADSLTAYNQELITESIKFLYRRIITSHLLFLVTKIRNIVKLRHNITSSEQEINMERIPIAFPRKERL